MARPPTYQSDEEKPVSVSLRVPKALYGRVQQHVQRRRMTLTEAILDGLTLWLDTPADPRDVRVSQENTVMQEWEAMVDARIEAALVRERTLAPPLALPTVAPELSYDDNNTVIQEEAGLRLTREASAALAPAVSYDDNNTVIQEKDVAVPPQRTRPDHRGISAAHKDAIVAEYLRCGRPPYEKFAKHLYDTELYRAIGNDGREAVVSTSALYRWIQQARKAGML
jgi:hypothetical protein